MKQGRKTTFEERVEIVNFTIAHEKDYQAAMEKYGVSYQQVYSWVRERSGNEAQSHTRRRVTTENQTVRRAESSP